MCAKRRTAQQGENDAKEDAGDCEADSRVCDPQARDMMKCGCDGIGSCGRATSGGVYRLSYRRDAASIAVEKGSGCI